MGAPGDDDLGSQSGPVHVFRLINTDDCTPNPCLNGAICADGLDTFSCHCARGYTGSTCATDVDECMATPSPCHVDAVCTNVPGSFQCACKPGFQGNGSTCTLIPPPPPDAAPELPDAGAGPDATTASPADAGSGDVDPGDLPGAGADATTKPPEDAGIGGDAPADGNGVMVDGASLDQAGTLVEAGAADGPRDVVTPQSDGAAGDTGLSPPDGGAGDGSSDGSHSPPTSDGCSCNTAGRQSGAWPFFVTASLFLGVARRRRIRRRDG